MGLFTLGTALAGFAHVFPLLLTGRMIQAAGSAILMPLLMNVMLVSFPVEKRGAAMGVFGLVLMAAPAIGPTLSGWIVQHYDWRMLFHFMTPIAVVVLLIGLFLLKDKKGSVDVRLDAFSLMLSTIGFGNLLYGFSAAGESGWSSPEVYVTIMVGVLGLAWFIWRQTRLEQPMLNFKVFQYPMFALSSWITMVLNMALFSGMLMIPIYVQKIRGISPLDAGLMMLPGALAMALMSPVTGKLFDRFGGKSLAVIGLSITAVTTLMFGQLTMETNYYYLMVLNAVRMLGMSMVMMPVSTNGLNQLPARLYPHGTAMNNTLNQVSGAIGTALLVTIMSTRAHTIGAELAAREMQRSGGVLTPEMEARIGMEAMLGGIDDSFLVAGGLTLVALILAFFIQRAKPAKDPLEGTPAYQS
jgi:EmrB/QacA subfamily drug resistance transporter